MRKCPALKWFTPSSRRCGRMAEQQQRYGLLAQSPLGATRVCLAGSQAAAAPICPSALAQRGAGLRSFDRRSGRCDGVPAVSGVPEPQRIVPEPQRMWCRSCRCAEPPQRELGQGDEIGTEQKNQTNKKADKDAGQQEPEFAHHSPRHACLSRARRINSAASTTSCRAASSTCSFST